MTIKKTLTSIVLAGALALSGAGCDIKSNENHTSTSESSAQTQPQYQTRNISGKIINVDEDSFPILMISGDGAGGANFQYELIRVQDDEGNIIQLLSPKPTGYQVGDNVTFDYKEISSITFSDLFKTYGIHGDAVLQKGVLQKGSIKMDGLIE